MSAFYYGMRRAKFLFSFTANKRCRLIKIGDKPYLERYLLGRVFGITFFLHRFLASDGDRFVHDHPWRWSLSWILCGGYKEERLQYLNPETGWHSRHRYLSSGWINVLTPRAFHRIQQPEHETWTLFVHGRRLKQWGFLNYDAETKRTSYSANQEPPETRAWKTTAPLGRAAGREPFYVI